MLTSVNASQEHRTYAFLFIMFLIIFSPSFNAGLTTQKMEGRSYSPELPGAYRVCLLISGSTLEVFARDVDTQLRTVQERSQGPKVAGG